MAMLYVNSNDVYLITSSNLKNKIKIKIKRSKEVKKLKKLQNQNSKKVVDCCSSHDETAIIVLNSCKNIIHQFIIKLMPKTLESILTYYS